MLNLTIPIGPFDQSDHDLATMLFCQCAKRVNRLGCAFAVGLNNYAKALPVGQIGMGQRGRYDVQRQSRNALSNLGMAPSEIDGVMGDNWYRFFENNFGPLA